jgi:hypothetical protein
MEKPEAAIIVSHGILMKALQSMGLFEVTTHMSVNALLEMGFTPEESNELYVAAMENMQRFDEALELLKPAFKTVPLAPGEKPQ